MCLEQVSRKAWRLSIYHSSCAAWRTTGLKNVEEKKVLRSSSEEVCFFVKGHIQQTILVRIFAVCKRISLFLKWPNKDSSQLFPLFCVTYRPEGENDKL